MLGRNAEEATDTGEVVRDQVDAAVEQTGAPEDGTPEDGTAAPEVPVMPAPPFPTFSNRPTLPHQVPGVGFESGRDSRAR